MTGSSERRSCWRSLLSVALGVVVVAVALDLRAAGSFRGLQDGYVFHPDAPKQVRALGNYLVGRYLWYTGTWFYDGYPYGLNHVDEGILRATIPLGRLLLRWVLPEATEAPMLDRSVLYYWVHCLRIFYGMVVFGTTVAVAALLTRRRVCIGLTAWLAALAPLSAVVTHSATGDIGVDLFTMFAVLLLAWHARRPHAIWLWLAGAMVGMAFSCKYNGALGGIPIGLYVVARAWQQRRWSLLAGGGVLALLGLGVGIMLGTPALWISWNQTWHDIGVNFENIRWYCVHESWRQRPLLDRLGDSIRTNGPRIGAALGWPLVAGAVAASVLLLKRGARGRAAEPAPDGREAAHLAISLYPLLALTISVLGKPVVQPFHFSYLVPPLILATVFLVDRLPAGRARAPHAMAAAFVVLALFDSATRARAERFFWVRDDIKAYHAYESVVLNPREVHQRSRGSVIRAFCLEPPNIAEFRNLPGWVRTGNPDGLVWTGLAATPLPTIPYPESRDWILLNGPTFPRDDRAFRTMPGIPVERHAVAYEEVPVLYVGIRSGMWPARVRLDVGGEKRLVELGVDGECVVEFRGATWRLGPGRDGIDTVRLCRIEARTELGDAWITVMRSAAERDAYALTGPDVAWTNALARDWPEPAPDTLAALECARFYDSEGTPPLRLDAADAREQERFLVVAGDESLRGSGATYPRIGDVVGYHDMPILRARSWGTLALPAGAYRWECEWGALDAGAEVSMRVEDPLGVHVGPLAEVKQSLAVGRQRVVLPLVKPYAPYECRLVVTCTAGRAELLQWRLVPDPGAMLQALHEWRAGGLRPAWGPAATPVEPHLTLTRVRTDASFGGRVRVRAVEYPAVFTAGDTLELRLDADLLRHRMRDYGDFDVFIHFYDQWGGEAYAERYPLDSLMSATHRGELMRMPIDPGLTPAPYELRLAIRNRYSHRRLDVKLGDDTDAAVLGRKLVIGRMQVREPAHDDAHAKK